MSKSEPPEEPIHSPLNEGDSDTGNGVHSTFSWSVNFLRPFAPQIVPIVVCTCFIPIILAISGFAGYVVWDSLSSKWQIPFYLQYGDGITPYAQSVVSSLHPHQRYDISLHLVLPASESNLALGNFMATLTLSTPNNQTLATVRRPAVAVASRLWWILGARNVIEIDIPMFTSFVARTSSLLADVNLGRHDNWKILGTGEGRELSVISVSLHGFAVAHGVRGVAMQFPLLSSLFAAFIFLLISTLILGVCILPMMLPAVLEDDDVLKSSSTSSVLFPPSERPRRKKKSQSRRSSERTSPSSSGIKEEASFTNIPPAEEAALERLRQRKISTNRELESEL